MKKIEVIDPFIEEHRYDIEKIQAAFKLSGYEITEKQAAELWVRYSEDRNSAWVNLQFDGSAIVYVLEHYFRVAD